MTDRIRQRIDTLEAQLRDVTARRDQAQTALSESMAAILQIQGALAVLRDLLVPVEVAKEDTKVAEVVASDG
jgi:uncharacterized coiled-coil DUF342 family protein